MTSSERRHCMRLMQQAQAGDEAAREQLTKEVVRLFSWMIRHYTSPDPAYDHSDLLLQFQFGIWQSIPKVDGRGDPLYHLAWRGQRSVSSMVSSIDKRRHGTDQWIEEFGEKRSIGTLPPSWDLPEVRDEYDPVAVVEKQEARAEARRQLAYLLSQVELSDRQRLVVAWTMVDPDPAGEGANLRLAQALGITPQAASKLREKVSEMLSGMQKPVQLYRCMRCGRGFKSPGALTQHKKGQSGHKPCTVKAAV